MIEKKKGSQDFLNEFFTFENTFFDKEKVWTWSSLNYGQLCTNRNKKKDEYKPKKRGVIWKKEIPGLKVRNLSLWVTLFIKVYVDSHIFSCTIWQKESRQMIKSI